MVKALVLDDNRSTADSVVKLLNVLGIQARAAYGSDPGLQLLSEEVPDMVLLDINMPGVGGFEVLKYISREPRFAKMPVFICSSDDQPQTRQQAMKNGARDFLLKPMTVDALERVLKKAKLL
jgi:twitching motility two-component system response regulator PilH